MGNAALRELAVIEETSLGALSGTVVAVDAHNWLYRYLTTTVRWTNEEAYTTAAGVEVPNLIGVVRGLPKFFENDIHPVFVFDGAVTDLKADEVADRREAKETAEAAMAEAKAAGDRIEAARLEAQTQRLTDDIQRTTRELFRLLDVQFLDAPAEGEAQAAHMAAAGAVDFVGTEDYDSLLFGAPQTLRKLTTREAPEIMRFQETLAKHDLTHEQLVDVAILCGTDFNEGLSGYGPKTALTAVKEHGSLDAVLANEGATIPEARAVQRLFLDPHVSDEYVVQTDVDPDLEAARHYVTQEWEVPDDEVRAGFERLEQSIAQTGLDRWT